MTSDQITEIGKRAEAATEGPWRIGKQSPNGANNIGTMGGLMTAQTTDKANAEFIAHARTDVPSLLAEIERLRTERDKLYSIALWGARRMAVRLFSRFMYDEIEKATGGSVDRDWRGERV